MSISEGDDAYIRSLIHFFGNQPDPWGIKDTKSVFIYANQPFRELVGMKNRNVEGLTDAGMDCETAAFADSFQAQDRLVEQGREKKIVLDVHPYANGWRVFTFTKTPLIMPSGRVAGTIFHGQDLTDTAGRIERAVMYLLLPSSGQAGSFETNVVGLNLTEREELVLFFLLRGRPAKDIAGMLGRSPLHHRTRYRAHPQQIRCWQQAGAHRYGHVQGLLHPGAKSPVSHTGLDAAQVAQPSPEPPRIGLEVEFQLVDGELTELNILEVFPA